MTQEVSGDPQAVALSLELSSATNTEFRTSLFTQGKKGQFCKTRPMSSVMTAKSASEVAAFGKQTSLLSVEDFENSLEIGLLGRDVQQWFLEIDRNIGRESFWKPLCRSRAPRATRNDNEREQSTLMVATAGLIFKQTSLFCGGDEDGQRAASDVHAALQAAALALVSQSFPGALDTPIPKVFREVPGFPWRLCAAPFSDTWVFTAVEVNPRFSYQVPCTLLLPAHAWPSSPHYLPHAQVCTYRLSSGDAIVETGANVVLTFLMDPSTVAAQCGGKLSESLCEQKYWNHLVNMFSGDLPSGIDLDWFRHICQLKKPIVVLQKFLGLTHPERPFAVSAAPVIVEDPSLISKLLDVCKAMGYTSPVPNLVGVPISFPPAISDIDQRLQTAHIRFALGDGSEAELVQAACDAVREILGDEVGIISEFDEAAMTTALRNAEALVQAAMGMLRRAQLSRRESEDLARGILDDILDKAWFDIKCRIEWSKIEARGKEWAKERRAAKHQRRRKGARHQASASEEKGTRETLMKRAIEEMQQRTVHYQHSATGIAGLVNAGLLHVSSRPLVESWDKTTAMAVDDGANSKPSQIKTPSSRIHFASVLDEVIARDKAFALANREEREVKLAMSVSLVLSKPDPPNELDVDASASLADEHSRDLTWGMSDQASQQ